MNAALSRLLVFSYVIWHGRLHLRGAGQLLRMAARILPGLRRYSVPVPGIGVVSLDFRDEGAFGWMNAILGEYKPEADVVRVLEQFTGPGSVFWDIGGNVGLISAHFASSSRSLSKIFLFEPHPTPFRMAESLFKGHPVVTTLNYGLSDIDGEMMLHCRSGCSSLASFRNEGRMGMSAIQVPVYRGDTVVDRFEVPPPDIIKIDVEGFEGEVIRGMERIMRTKRPVIVFEHLFLSDEAVAALDGNDYTVRTILRGGTLHGSGFARGAGKDSALMPREKLGEVRPSSCETQEGGRLSTHNMSLPQSRK